jgi:hypothetical protein
MWRQMKDWLAKGAIPDEEQLALQICLPGYHINRSKLVLETRTWRREAEVSPDDADALALTFAQPVMPIEAPPEEFEGSEILAGFRGIGGGWMG